jgi:hypothetical protein
MGALSKLDGEAIKTTDYAKLIGRARRVRDLFSKGGDDGSLSK